MKTTERKARIVELALAGELRRCQQQIQRSIRAKRRYCSQRAIWRVETHIVRPASTSS